MQRALLIFQNSLRSPESVKGYTYRLERFLKFYKLKDFDSLVAIPPEKLQIMIEDYVMHIKKNINPNTVPSYVYPLKLFCESNNVDLKWRKIKKLFPAPVKITGDAAYSTADIKKILESTPILKNKALIHFLASTGCRIGALSDLQLRHIIQMPNSCKAVQVYEDSIEEYYTFLTPEASNALDEYLDQRRKDKEDLTPKSPVFRTKYAWGMAKAKSLTKKAMQAIIDRALRNANIRHFSEKRNGRYKTQLDHGFRKRFDTILKLNKNVNDNIIEKMMGHKKGLDGVYLKPTIEEMFEEFEAGIVDLTIDDSLRKQAELDKIKKENKETDEIKTKLENSWKMIDDLKLNQEQKIDEIMSMISILKKKMEEHDKH